MTFASRSRVALRLAWRDLSRHKIRTLVGVLLFALPVALVVGFFSSIESYDNSPDHSPLVNTGYIQIGPPMNDTGNGTRPVDEVVDDSEGALREVLGDRTDSLSPGVTRSVEASHDQRTEDITVTAVSPASDGSDPLVPRGSILLSPENAYLLDIDTGDTVTVDGTELTASVTSRTYSETAVNALDVEPDSFAEYTTWYFPADPDEAHSIYDALSQSRGDLDIEEGIGEISEPTNNSPLLLDYTGGTGGSSTSTDDALVAVSLAALTILLISAVISPVFAVAARRLRRAMGLLSASGAAPDDLRRIMLAEGLLVSVMGVTLGLLGSIGIGAGLSHLFAPGEFTWAWDMAIPVVAVTLICGVTSALVPALRAGRENPVQALADGGSERMTGFRKRMLVGIPFLVLGALCCIVDSNNLLVQGTALLGIGVVLSGSLLVWALSRAGRFLPTAGRLAVRDGQRNHHRTVPAVAAVAGVTFLAVVMTSVPVNNSAPSQFNKDVALVSGTIGGDESVYAEDIDTIADTLGAHDRTTISTVTGAERDNKELAPTVHRPSGEQNITDYSYNTGEGQGRAYTPELSLQQDIAVHDGSAFSGYSRISDEEASRAETALAEGKAVVGDPDLVVNGEVAVDLLDHPSNEDSTGDSAPEPHTVQTFKIPAVVVESVDGALGAADVSISPSTARSLDLEVTYNTTVLSLKQDVTGLQAALVSSGTWPTSTEFVTVETPGVDGVRAGFTIIPVVLSWILTLGTVLLVVLLASSESRRDMTTITAVGAPPGLMRRFAATQAVFIALGGTLAGVVFGLIPKAGEAVRGYLGVDFSDGFLSSGQWLAVGLTVVVGPALAWAAGEVIGAVTSRDTNVVRRRD